MITCKCYMHRTIKTIVILKPKSATAGFETGTAAMQNPNLMSDRLSITPRSYSPESDMFGVDILGATLFLTNERFSHYLERRSLRYSVMLIRNSNDSASVVTGIRTKKYRGHVHLWLCSASGVRRCLLSWHARYRGG